MVGFEDGVWLSRKADKICVFLVHACAHTNARIYMHRQIHTLIHTCKRCVDKRFWNEGSIYWIQSAVIFFMNATSNCIVNSKWSWGSVVGIVIMPFFPKVSSPTLAPMQPPCTRYCSSVTRHEVEHSHCLLTRLGMYWSVRPLPNMPSWHGA